MYETRLTCLLHIYFENNATAAEIDELMALLAISENEAEVKTVMDRIWEEYQDRKVVFPTEKSKAILTSIMKVKSLPVTVDTKKRRLWAYAAAVLFLMGSLTIYQVILKKRPVQELAKTTITQPDIAPGGNKAVLTLSDGSTIILDSAQNGLLAQQAGTKVLKLGDGQLAYNTLQDKPVELLYNTIATPRGGQYRLTLPDGSKVWLNAASSVRFPVAFTAKERKIEITGEVYIEVVKNPSIPFIVNVAQKANVTVLGTKFNINSYADETAIRTTLLEGSVAFSGRTAGESRLLTPGQQARLNSNGQIDINTNVNLEEVTAWKDGRFHFVSADLESIMRQLARWYDIEIGYEGNIPERQFSGKIDRNTNLSNVMRILEESNIHFRIEEKKLIVINK
jgi:transmembrane sensor